MVQRYSSVEQSGSGLSSGDLMQLANMTIQNSFNAIAQGRDLQNIQSDASRNAAQVMRAARQQISSLLEQERQVAGARRAAFGAAGVSQAGSTQAVAEDAADVASRTAGRVQQAALRQANELRRQRRRAKSAQGINQVMGATQIVAGLALAPFTGGLSLLMSAQGAAQVAGNTNT